MYAFPRVPFGPTSGGTLISLMRAATHVHRYLERRFSLLELTPVGFAALRAIALNEGCCISDLARTLGLTKAGARRLVQTLEERWLILSTASDHDRRRTVLSVTFAGRGQLDKALEIAAHLEKPFEATVDSMPFAQWLEMRTENLTRSADPITFEEGLRWARLHPLVLQDDSIPF